MPGRLEFNFQDFIKARRFMLSLKVLTVGPLADSARTSPPGSGHVTVLPCEGKAEIVKALAEWLGGELEVS